MDPVVLSAIKVGMNDSSELSSSMSMALKGIERSQRKVNSDMSHQVAEYEELAAENGAPVDQFQTDLTDPQKAAAERVAHTEHVVSTISTIATLVSGLSLGVSTVLLGKDLLVQGGRGLIGAATNGALATDFGAQSVYQLIQAKIKKASADVEGRVTLDTASMKTLQPVMKAITSMIQNQLSSAQTLGSVVSTATKASKNASVGRR